MDDIGIPSGVSTVQGPVTGAEREFLRDLGDRGLRFRTWVRSDGPSDLLLTRRGKGRPCQIELRSGVDGYVKWLVEADGDPSMTGVDGNADGTPDMLVPMRRGKGRSVFALLSGEGGEAIWTRELPGYVSTVRWNGRPRIVWSDGGRIHLLDPPRKR